MANPHKIRIAVRRYQAGGKQAWSQSALSGSWHLLGVLELRNSFQRLLRGAWQNQLVIDQLDLRNGYSDIMLRQGEKVPALMMAYETALSGVMMMSSTDPTRSLLSL